MSKPTARPSTGGAIPDWTLADRLGRSLRWAGVSRAEMANYLQVSPRTISAYTAGEREPRAWALRGWAELTGVDLHWLETGGTPTPQ